MSGNGPKGIVNLAEPGVSDPRTGCHDPRLDDLDHQGD